MSFAALVNRVRLYKEVELLKREGKLTSVSPLPAVPEIAWKVVAKRRCGAAALNKEQRSFSTRNIFSALENDHERTAEREMK